MMWRRGEWYRRAGGPEGSGEGSWKYKKLVGCMSRVNVEQTLEVPLEMQASGRESAGTAKAYCDLSPVARLQQKGVIGSDLVGESMRLIIAEFPFIAPQR